MRALRLPSFTSGWVQRPAWLRAFLFALAGCAVVYLLNLALAPVGAGTLLGRTYGALATVLMVAAAALAARRRAVRRLPGRARKVQVRRARRRHNRNNRHRKRNRSQRRHRSGEFFLPDYFSKDLRVAGSSFSEFSRNSGFAARRPASVGKRPMTAMERTPARSDISRSCGESPT